MASFSISEVEELTGVKAHILRYWEEAIPGFSVQKDIGGRRVYSQNDVDIILRLKYLIFEKNMTTKNARKQIIEDATAKTKNIDLIQEIHDVRGDLSDLYLHVKRNKKEKQTQNKNVANTKSQIAADTTDSINDGK